MSKEKIEWVVIDGITGLIGQQILMLHHNQPVVLDCIPHNRDCVLAGMIPSGSNVIATVEQENKFGIISYLVVFTRMGTGERQVAWHSDLELAMHDFRTELMLDISETPRTQSSTMISQYSDDTGFGKWA